MTIIALETNQNTEHATYTREPSCPSWCEGHNTVASNGGIGRLHGGQVSDVIEFAQMQRPDGSWGAMVAAVTTSSGEKVYLKPHDIIASAEALCESTSLLNLTGGRSAVVLLQRTP